MFKKTTVPFDRNIGKGFSMDASQENLESLLYLLRDNYEMYPLNLNREQLNIGGVALEPGPSVVDPVYFMEVPEYGRTVTYNITPDGICIMGEGIDNNRIYDCKNFREIFNIVDQLYKVICDYIKDDANTLDSVICYLIEHYKEYKLKFAANGFISLGDNFIFKDYPNAFPHEPATYWLQIDSLEYYIGPSKVIVRDGNSQTDIKYTGDAKQLHANVQLLYRDIVINNIKKYNWQTKWRAVFLWGLLCASSAATIAACLQRHFDKQPTPSQKEFNMPPKTTTTCAFINNYNQRIKGGN